MVLFLCKSSNRGLYLYKVSQKKSGRYESYRTDTIFMRKISKGHNSIKDVSRVTFLFLCKSSHDSLHLFEFHENILDGIKVIERTGFL